MPSLYNDPVFKNFRRDLRKNQTDAEKKLWSILRNKQVNGLKFFRQYSVGSYILDFFCPEKRLAIELDGGQHNEEINKEKDQQRTDYLAQQHIRVIRFWNNAILQNIDAVYEKILNAIQE